MTMGRWSACRRKRMRPRLREPEPGGLGGSPSGGGHWESWGGGAQGADAAGARGAGAGRARWFAGGGGALVVVALLAYWLGSSRGNGGEVAAGPSATPTPSATLTVPDVFKRVGPSVVVIQA